MLDRAACERRVYRLATLLTGNPIAATSVIAQVVDAQPDLRQLDGAHMDRLTVLRSRDIAPATLVSEAVDAAVAGALAALTPQQREAWILTRVYQTPDRETARAMDCSVTATHRHLEQADTSMGTTVVGLTGSDAAQMLLAYSMTLDVPAFHRDARKRRRQLKLAAIIIAVVLATALIAALAAWWTRP